MERPNLFEEFKLYVEHISVKAAIDLCLMQRVMGKIHLGEKWAKQARKRFFSSNFSEVLSRYDCYERNKEQLIDADFKIFTFWYQGWDALPEVIAECHKSLIRNANGHEVVLIDKNNIDEYCDVPDIMKKRLEAKEIAIPHFKDWLSCYILNKYGGLWIDAGVYVTQPIDVSGKSFYSVRYKNRKGAYCDFKYIMALMGLPRGNMLAALMSDILLTYWSKYSAALHYLFFDDIMKELYERVPYIRRLLNSNDLYCDCYYEFRYLAGKVCDEERLQEIVAKNKFLSLTYRFPIPMYVEGKPTYYNRLLQMYGGCSKFCGNN